MLNIAPKEFRMLILVIQLLPATTFAVLSVHACNLLLGRQALKQTDVTYTTRTIVLLALITAWIFIDLPKVPMHILNCSSGTLSNSVAFNRAP